MQVAQVVLLDSDFSHMKQIIGEGRQVINNITRSASLFLYKNLFSFLLAVFSIIHFMTYPLKPSQISLVSMFNIGIPAFLLAMEKNEKKQEGHFLSVVFRNSIPAALTSFFTIAGMVLFGDMFHIPENDVSVASCFLLSAAGFMILWKLCKPMNRYRTWIFILCVAGFCMGAYFLSELFSITTISIQCLALVFVFAFAEESLMRNITLFVNWYVKRKKERAETAS